MRLIDVVTGASYTLQLVLFDQKKFVKDRGYGMKEKGSPALGIAGSSIISHWVKLAFRAITSSS